MFSIEGYHFKEKLYESKNTIIYRGIRNIDKLPIVAKVLKKDYPTLDELDLFEYEYKVTKKLDFPGIIKVYNMESIGHSKAIIMEDFEAMPLNHFMKFHQIGLEGSIEIIMTIVDTLSNIHNNNLIYKNLNPQNILINPVTNTVKLIDLGIATEVKKDTQSAVSPEKLEGNLFYISPEQTGRMNRSIDFRTDFYSLGVIFYEMLTGSVTFECNDKMELIHCHIARQPIPPSELKNDIPMVISNIIMRLISKTAEERYQSALSLKSDLEECYRQLKSNGKIESFEIGKKDILESFQICEKLYGREKEVETLFSEFNKVLEGNVRTILFNGPPGIGKTFLINEIQKPLLQHNGYFISGKFDQYKDNIPYSAIIEAFSELIKQILMETEENLEKWKNKLLSSLGINGQIIIDLIPELELIIGKQPSVPKMDPMKSQSRFNLTFQNFIKTFTQFSHPLVIFIDDLQWADQATLGLLKILLTDSNSKHLLFIGAYRANALDDIHALMTVLNEIDEPESNNITYIPLNPLELIHINQLISDTLHCTYEESKPLARLIKQKTQGNAFFVVQLLYTLYHEGILEFDSNSLKWRYDLESVSKMKSSDNVVDLMIDRLRDLPKDTQRILQIASCIGNTFDLHTLSLIYNKQYRTTINHLSEAIQEGFILPSDKNYKLTPVTIENDNNRVFKFLHDKVQQASYSLIPQRQKEIFHLKIARSLKHSIDENKLEDKVFDIVNHFNQSLNEVNSEVEKIQIAKLNLMAGKKAKRSSAYNSALDFLTIGMSLLSEDKWRSNYNLMFDLHREQSELEYLNGDFEKAELLITQSLAKTKTALDKSQLYMILIVMYTMSAKYNKAIQIGVEALDKLGVSLPINNLSTELDKELKKSRELLANRPIESLIENQDMTSPDKIAVMKLLTKLAPLAYLTNSDLWSFIAVKRVNLSIQHGNIAESAHSYTNYGIFLSQYDEYQSGYEFGLLGLKVSEKWSDASQKCRAYFNLACFLIPWVKHMNNADPLYRKGYKLGLKSGDFQFVGYIFMVSLLNSFRTGTKLDSIREGMEKFLSFSLKTKNQHAIDTISGFKLIINHLTIKNPTNENEELNEQLFVEKCTSTKDFLALCYYYITQSQITYIYGNPSKSIDYILKSKDLLTFVLGTTSSVEYNFYYSLNLAALYKNAPAKVKKQYKEQISINQKQMKIWSDSCKENFLHKYLLVEAEAARISCEYDKAIDLYDQSIKSAKDNGFIHSEALANELAAKFHLSKGRERIAAVYMKDAYYLYDLWGAKAKIKILEEDYNDIFLQSSRKERCDCLNNPIDNGKIIDMDTVIKASQTISSEIELDKLLKKLLKISIESSGAEKGFLIMATENKLTIRGEINHENVKLMSDIPLEKCEDISQSIVNYVARTREHIVLDDASTEGLFSTDSYIVKNKSKSILCMPIIYRGSLIAIGYLENNLSLGAFTTSHIKILKILFSQAAISIENAVMYNKIKELNQGLEKIVHGRTKELNEIVKKLKSEISERKRTELELIKSENRYRLLVELLPDGVLVHDNFEILFANDICAKFFRAVNSKGLINRSVKDLVHSDYHGVIDERLQHILTTGKAAPLYDLKVVGDDGTLVDIESISTSFPYQGKSAILSVVRDITDRKQAEKLRKSVEDKERLLKEAFEYDRIKTEFIANISHELRTPLNVMLGAIQMFNLLLDDNSSEISYSKITKYSGMMKQNCYRLIRLVNNLIDITKIDAGYFQLDLKQCNIVSIIEDITLSVAEYVKDKGIKLIFDTDIEEKIMPCDPDKMERILLNLLSNAIKFTDRGGYIFINLKNKDQSILISVKDTGTGILEEKQKVIFDRFVQADKSLSRNSEGSGIGLSLVKSFVELQGGTISLKSKPGEGSEFIIELPVQELVAQDTIEEIAITDSNKERIQIEFSDIYF
ncbi:AAA family ATPase [Wukongibacter baidiensis]|uniref:MASE3 domain-containing sensor histidine kinase n=1 Tax=Wukongibacter baidiensis TaxID=1723361 RepID=UPI003D7F910D